MIFDRKYNSAFAGADAIEIVIWKADFSAPATDSDWTPEAGDVKISEIGSGTESNIATLPTFVAGAWRFVGSAGETSLKYARIRLNAEEVEPGAFIVRTFGHANAAIRWDFTSAEIEEIASDATNAGENSYLILGELNDNTHGLAEAKTQRDGLLETSTFNDRLSSARAAHIDKLNVLTEDEDGLRFSAKALEEAPAGEGGGGLSQQQVRDAMAMDLGDGVEPAAGSIDQKIGAIVPGDPVNIKVRHQEVKGS